MQHGSTADSSHLVLALTLFSQCEISSTADLHEALSYHISSDPSRRSEPVTMWMKNTYLPLDMLFIRKDGTVSRIAADTEPLSTAIIASGGPVSAVLELNAGTAAKLGIQAGDRVEHPLFKGR